MKGLQTLVRWFLVADDNLDAHQNLMITFCPFVRYLKICMQIYSMVYAWSQQIKMKKCTKTISPLRSYSWWKMT